MKMLLQRPLHFLFMTTFGLFFFIKLVFPFDPSQETGNGDIWNKRAWNDVTGSWGKRGWSDMEGGWGKRVWERLDGPSEKELSLSSVPVNELEESPELAKRAHWSNLKGLWGKRFGGKEDSQLWNEMSLNRLRQKKAWENLRNSWGKRSENIIRDELEKAKKQ